MFEVNNIYNESNDFLSRFCSDAKITYLNISLNEFNQKNSTILNFFNNILIRKISKKELKNTKKNFKRDNSLQNLSPYSGYVMVEKNYLENEFSLESLIQPKLKFRTLSYNPKLSKN